MICIAETDLQNTLHKESSENGLQTKMEQQINLERSCGP